MAPAARKASPPLILADAIGACVEYGKVLQQEKTKRAEIRAKRDVAVAAIQSQERLLRDYVDKRFSERKDVLDGLLKMLNAAMAEKSELLLDKSLLGIVSIIKENPLDDIESIRQNLAKPGFILDL